MCQKPGLERLDIQSSPAFWIASDYSLTSHHRTLNPSSPAPDNASVGPSSTGATLTGLDLYCPCNITGHGCGIIGGCSRARLCLVSGSQGLRIRKANSACHPVAIPSWSHLLGPRESRCSTNLPTLNVPRLQRHSKPGWILALRPRT